MVHIIQRFTHDLFWNIVSHDALRSLQTVIEQSDRAGIFKNIILFIYSYFEAQTVLYISTVTQQRFLKREIILEIFYIKKAQFNYAFLCKDHSLQLITR